MILFSFDIEEFDMPFEYGTDISFDEQINISITGTDIILDLLKKHGIAATFFSTATFAINAPGIIQRIKDEGHELGSHTYYHSRFELQDILSSKLKLEELSGMEVFGFRMPRMAPVSVAAIQKAGYEYNSSINPTWLPGRYNNLHIPRKYFKQENIMQLPASVSPWFRIPLFWLSFHNFPLWLYRRVFARTMQRDGYVNVYFHPWEFTDLTDKKRFNFPAYVSRNSGVLMLSRMDSFMAWCCQQDYRSARMIDFVRTLQ